MVRKFLLVSSWMVFGGMFLVFNLYKLYVPEARSYAQGTPDIISAVPGNGFSTRLSSNHTGKVLGATVTAGDARQQLLDRFMKGAPLAPYSGKMIELADQYGMDFRLVPAIGMCESNLGKRIPSSDSHNAFGIAVYTGQQEGAKFKDWNRALEWVFEFIHTKYISRNIIDLKEIAKSWAPPSVEKDHSWANCVEKFMRSIQ